MLPNIIVGALSALILQKRGLATDQVVAGAAISSLTPGMFGLVVPLVLARQSGSPVRDGVVKLVRVQNAVGLGKDPAVKLVEAQGLRATVKPGEIQSDAQIDEPGTVVAQQPTANTVVAVGDTVLLYVSPDTRVSTGLQS
jgi:hypothetical protein